MKVEYLKNSYKWKLRTVAVLNCVVFWAVAVLHAEFSEISVLLNSIAIKDGIIGLLAPIAVFVLDGLLSADSKARVAYWRYQNPLPGSRAFSELLERDARADPECLANDWGEFPKDPAEQNRLWYRIYRSFEKEIRVHEAHRAWLFSRDLTGHAVVFLVVFGLGALLGKTPWNIYGPYLLALGTQYLAMMMAARIYGNRFVTTVLAIASESSASDRAPQVS